MAGGPVPRGRGTGRARSTLQSSNNNRFTKIIDFKNYFAIAYGAAGGAVAGDVAHAAPSATTRDSTHFEIIFKAFTIVLITARNISQEEPWLGDVARMLEDNGLPGHAVDDAVRKWAAHDYNL